MVSVVIFNLANPHLSQPTLHTSKVVWLPSSRFTLPPAAGVGTQRAPCTAYGDPKSSTRGRGGIPGGDYVDGPRGGGTAVSLRPLAWVDLLE